MSNENAVKNLIRIEDKANPTLFRALQLLIDDLYKVHEEIFPSKSSAVGEQTSSGGKVLAAPANFQGVAYPDNLRLDWDDLIGAFRYKIRIGEEWDTARHILTTATDMANVDPVYLNLIYGTYNFLLRGINVNGQLGDTAQAVLVVPTILPPELDVQVVISTVLLRWTIPASTWRIDYYIVYKNNVEIGTISGTFKLIQEQIGGTYSYTVAAVDIVGNISTRSAIKTVILHDPSEYEFVDSLAADYIDGAYVRTQLATIDGTLGVLGPTLVHTWQEHFQTFGFASPQAQVDAGYPFYYQPSYIGDGTYTELFDFGEILTKLTIVVDYNKYQLVGFTNITTVIKYSNDNINWSLDVFGSSTFAESFRFVTVILIFTNVDDKSIAFVSNLQVVLNVTLTLDSGSTDCLKTDAGGTLITYNKTYTGISSVTATAAVSLQPLYAVCDNITKDNFRCLIFDSSGNRANATINWKSRGVV